MYRHFGGLKIFQNTPSESPRKSVKMKLQTFDDISNNCSIEERNFVIFYFKMQ